LKKVPEFLLLGCGYTGQRVARKLILSGATVISTNRTAGFLEGAECLPLDASDRQSVADLAARLSPGMLVMHSIPPAGGPLQPVDYTAALVDLLRPLRPVRVVYISTTGVYGAAQQVDEYTPVAPDTARDVLRVEAENMIAAGPWEALILRPAAIYGPGRGVHESVRLGRFEASGGRVISRIHVDDLAEHVFAGLHSKVTGAFPVADEEPCASMEVARFAAGLLGLKEPEGDMPITGRRVDGSGVRRELGIALRYASYRQGVAAALKETV
jgi:nucleoside-diphosphate-sugar epimerase